MLCGTKEKSDEPGSDGLVAALAVYNGKLYVGGHFTTAGGASANRIASWDGASWSTLSTGTDSVVKALTVHNGKLCVGGWFTAAGGVPANYIALWDGNAWLPLGSGLNNTTSALTLYNQELVAGGAFGTAGGKNASCVAVWNKDACPVAMTGDVNANGGVSSSDIIYLVNFVFKAGPAPLPCPAVGDVNCTGGVVGSADIIYLVNNVFKAGAPACDVCTLIPGTWSCP